MVWASLDSHYANGHALSRVQGHFRSVFQTEVYKVFNPKNDKSQRRLSTVRLRHSGHGYYRIKREKEEVRKKSPHLSAYLRRNVSAHDNHFAHIPVNNMTFISYGYDEERLNGSDVNGSSTDGGEKASGSTKDWEWYAEAITVPVLVVLGLVGNTLSFLVMSSPNYNCKAFNLYLRSLAISDSLTLISELFTWIDKLTDADLLRYHTSITCKLADFCKSVICLMSSWLIVAFTIDRFLAVCQPLKRQILCSLERIRFIIILLLILTSASQIFRLVLVERLDRPGRSPCHASVDLRLLYFRLDYFLYDILLRFFLPFVVILVCNSFIIMNIVRMSPIRRASASWEKRKTNLAIYMLFIVSFVFVITMAPSTILSVTWYVLFESGHRGKTYYKLRPFNTPFKLLRMTNYAVNIFLYGLTGKEFRTELKKQITCSRRKNRQKYINVNMI